MCVCMYMHIHNASPMPPGADDGTVRVVVFSCFLLVIFIFICIFLITIIIVDITYIHTIIIFCFICILPHY